MKKTKFCILSSQRSGSTWLRELLNSSDVMVSFPELFISDKPHHNWSDDNFRLFYEYEKKHRNIRPFSTYQYLNQLDRYPGKHSLIGFKLMYDQLLLHPEVIIHLVSNQFKIIHLVRRNYLDTMVSLSNMKEKRIVQSRSDIKLEKVILNPRKLLFDLYKHDLIVNIFSRMLTILPCQVLNITYEELYENLDEALLLITDFLGVKVDSSKFYTDLKRISEKSLSDKIENYNEVKKALSGSKFEYLLNFEISSRKIELLR